MASRSSSSRRPPLALTQPVATVRVHALDQSCTFVEIGSPAFDLNHVLLRRHFLNVDKSKYVSVGFYPAKNYQPLVVFGSVKHPTMLLTSGYVALPALVEAM
jgi:hypothetical protein